MATITAVQNGNWSDASTWDLNRVPTVDDDVFIENYVIVPPSNIIVNSLHSFGGQLNIGRLVITGDVFIDNSGTLLSGGRHYTINGDVQLDKNTGIVANTNNAGGGNSIINGNVYIAETYIGNNWNTPSQYYGVTTVNGNIVNKSQSLIFPVTTSNSLVINGSVETINLMSYSTLTSSSLTIYGNVVCKKIVSSNNRTACYLYGGTIVYDDGQIPNCNIIVGEETTIINLNESNNISLLTKYQLDNIEQYPAENDVKINVPYAYGVKVGTMEPVTVTNTNTINVYSYKKYPSN